MQNRQKEVDYRYKVKTLINKFLDLQTFIQNLLFK